MEKHCRKDRIDRHLIPRGLLYYPGPIPERPRPQSDHVWRPEFIDLSLLAPEYNRVNLKCDVVVVGSGAGGGVVAAELAKEGYQVILLDKAIYTHTSDLPLTELQSFDLLYEQKGTLMTEDGSLRILAGNAWGGGTAINWSASLQTPLKTRQEWATRYGLPYFASTGYQKAIDAVCERIGVGVDRIKHNPSNQILLDGCEKLGFNGEAIPQNTAGHEHSW
jgi:hypothetical protein